VFTKQTRLAGLAFCALWILYFAGPLKAIVNPASAHPAPATTPQHLPWPAGEVVYVNQGNDGPYTHRDESRYAWDFALAEGDPVHIGLGGIVEEVRDGCTAGDRMDCNEGYGNTVSVRAEDGTCARFEHLSRIAVTEHEVLATGALIGAAGATGNATGPHLHYQRERCGTGISIPSSFIEAGLPAEGARVTSTLPVVSGSFQGSPG